MYRKLELLRIQSTILLQGWISDVFMYYKWKISRTRKSDMVEIRPQSQERKSCKVNEFREHDSTFYCVLTHAGYAYTTL